MGIHPGEDVRDSGATLLDVAESILPRRLYQFGSCFWVLCADGERLIERLERTTEIPAWRPDRRSGHGSLQSQEVRRSKLGVTDLAG
jgi:hypothetical protein